MDELIDGPRERIPHCRGRGYRACAHPLTIELEARNKQVMADLETTARTHGFGVHRPGRSADVPDPARQAAFGGSSSTSWTSRPRRRCGAADRLTRQVEKAARLVRAHNAKFEAEQNAALASGASALIQREMRAFIRPLRRLVDRCRRFLRRVRSGAHRRLGDLFDPPEPARPDSGDSEEGDPELATRLSRFRVNLLKTNQPGDPAPVVMTQTPPIRTYSVTGAAGAVWRPAHRFHPHPRWIAAQRHGRRAGAARR